jgi:Ni/Co efflux regulator RcnB
VKNRDIFAFRPTLPSAGASKAAEVFRTMHLRRAFAVSTLALTLAGGFALAQPGHYVKHPEWKKGYHMSSSDWGRGSQVDWHAQHLRQPPAGYEWRMIDGNYVCANTSGVVFSVQVAK